MEKKTYVGKDATDHLMSLKDGDYVIIDGNKVFHLTIDGGDAVRFDHVHNVIYVNRNEMVPCTDAARECGVRVDDKYLAQLSSLIDHGALQ